MAGVIEKMAGDNQSLDIICRTRDHSLFVVNFTFIIYSIILKNTREKKQ